MSTFHDIRPSQLAGSWYPVSPKALADSVDSYIAEAQLPEISGEIAALISPHAGHVYSGPVAGYAYKTLLGKGVNKVVVLSPFHQFHSGKILSTRHDAYQTPLGKVPIDQENLSRLDEEMLDRTGIGLTKIRNDQEHAVEVLLPFLQRVLPDGFSLLPLMIRDQEKSLMKALGLVLAEVVQTQGTLLVASTDLSHFHTAVEAKSLDQTIIDAIQTLDAEGLYRAEREGSGAACGLGPLAAVIWGTTGCGSVTPKILNYAHSGDITGDHSRVVGYASAVLIRD
jgi:AmmeMemoRadiSam system protein B